MSSVGDIYRCLSDGVWEISGEHMNEESYREIERVLSSSSKNIRLVDFEYLPRGDGICKSLLTNTTVEVIHLRSTLFVDGGECIGDLIEKNTTVRELYLVNDAIDDISSIARGLCVNTTLKELSLDGTDITIFEDLDGALKVNTALRFLSVGELFGLEWMDYNTSLKHLSFTNPTVPLDDLFIAIRTNTTIRSLAIDYSRIAVKEEMVVGMLSSNTTLTLLEIDSSGMVKCDDIFKILETNTSLRHLSLRNNRIPIDGRALGRLLRVNGTLETIDLFTWCTGISHISEVVNGVLCNSSVTELEMSTFDASIHKHTLLNHHNSTRRQKKLFELMLEKCSSMGVL